MAKIRALIVPGLVALAWFIPAAWIAMRAWSPKEGGHGEPRALLIPLAPDTFRHVGATHVGLIAGPGHLWAVLPERTGAVKRAVRIHESMTQFPGQASTYPRVARLELVTTAATSRWYNAYAANTPADAVTAAIEFGPDDNGTFVARLAGHEIRVRGNPSFPTQVEPGALANAVSPQVREQLADWCVIARDLGRVSRGHQTFHTLVATRVANAVTSLCCMSDRGACPGQPVR